MLVVREHSTWFICRLSVNKAVECVACQGILQLNVSVVWERGSCMSWLPGNTRAFCVGCQGTQQLNCLLSGSTAVECVVCQGT